VVFTPKDEAGKMLIGVFFAGFLVGVGVAILLRPPGDVRRVVHFFSIPPACETPEAASGSGVH
jgi:hypothetical protein